MPDLSVDLAPGAKRSLVLPNPVMVASGTFGYGHDHAAAFDVQRLGAVVAKRTPRPPDPRYVATAVAQAGAAALSVATPQAGVPMYPARAPPLIGHTIAASSSPALPPVALRHVWHVAGCVDVPIIGCGGIS